MSDSFHVDVVGLEQFVAKYRNAPRIIGEEMGTAGKKAGIMVERQGKANAPVWRGHLRRSITSTKAPFGTTVSPLVTTTMVGSNLPYADVMEKGRRPDRPAPPTAAIAAYLSAKGKDPRAAWVVARKIGRDGIEGKFYMRRALEALKPRIRQEFEDAKRRAIARIVGGR